MHLFHERINGKPYTFIRCQTVTDKRSVMPTDMYYKETILKNIKYLYLYHVSLPTIYRYQDAFWYGRRVRRYLVKIPGRSFSSRVCVRMRVREAERCLFGPTRSQVPNE